MKRGRVLVVDDDPLIRRLVPKILEKLECDIISVATGEEALEHLNQTYFDLILLDLRLPGISGIDVLKETRLKSPGTSVVVITAYGSVESARQALKLGASDYLEKPFDPEQMRMLARRAFGQGEATSAKSGGQVPEDIISELLGNSRAMEELRHSIERMAPTRSAVLITGEPGTGKNLVARLTHQSSDRAGKPFVAVDCKTGPCELLASLIFGRVKNAAPDAQDDQRGFFEQADQGTIFFNEVSELAPELQPRILRVIQESAVSRIGSDQPVPVDVRVIAASSQELKPLADSRRFDQNLFQRLNAVPLHIPALRDRKEDIPLLINHFLAGLRAQGLSRVNLVSPQFLEALQNYDFPGNVQELQELVSSCTLAASSNALSADTIPPEILRQAEASELTAKSRRENLTLKQAKALAVERMESRLIRQVLQETHGNFSLAARRLGISRSALYYKTKKYKIFFPD